MAERGPFPLPNHHRRQYHPYLSRRRKAALLAVSTLIFIALSIPAVTQLRGYSLKWLPTNFQPLREGAADDLAPSQPFRLWSGGDHGLDVDGRYIFKRNVAAGQEGSIGLYWDREANETVAIKTFTGRHRNPIPPATQRRFATAKGWISHWPAEIEAGLLLTHRYRSQQGEGVDDPALPTPSFPVPRDYFVIEYPYRYPAKVPVWHMVTPYISHGSLKQFATSMTGRVPPDQVAEYDQRLRSTVFDELFTTLQWIHDAGFCHNDVKPSNVFVESGPSQDEDIPGRLLLSDFGNVREIGHPYYRSAVWGPARNQWVDCVANDVRRLLKTYLFYLRATVDRDWFDVELYAEREVWSKLYWSFVRSPGDVRHLRALEREVQSPASVRSAKSIAKSEGAGDFGHRRLSSRERMILDASVVRELKCNSLGINVVSWWRLGGFNQPYVLEQNNRRSTLLPDR